MHNTPYSWQQKNWQQLVSRVQRKQLPHALLFVGDNGIGKRQFATAFASALLCPHFEAQGVACKNCHACHLTAAGTHPDLMTITAEPGHAIKIDQIRELTDSANQTALLNGYRVIIIHPATAMNINASNALLKTLEEPSAKTLLILISDLTLNLPATILSRCQKIIFSQPTTDEGLVWLNNNIGLQQPKPDLPLLLDIANGAPLAALDFFNQGYYHFRQEFYTGLVDLSENKKDPVALAEHWQEKETRTLLALLFSWLRDLLRLKTAIDTRLVNSDLQNVLVSLSKKLETNHLLTYIDHLQKIFYYRQTGFNLNQRLLLEELLIKWAQYATC